jgi:tRNA threonylcarbamoyladenosine biosynthesis protein TsaE
MLILNIPSTDALDDAARKLIDVYSGSRIFAIYGEMGAGKTTLIKAICRALEVDDVTSSPSFGIIHEYRTRPGDSIYHFDFYRIENIEEVFDIGYEEYLFSGDYCFLEWPELVENILPDETVRLSLRVKDDGVRVLEEKAFPQ